MCYLYWKLWVILEQEKPAQKSQNAIFFIYSIDLQCVYSINHVICPKKVQIMAYSSTRYPSFRVVLHCYPVLTTTVWRISWFEMAFVFCTRIWLFTTWLYDVFLSSSFEHKEICIMSWLICCSQSKCLVFFCCSINSSASSIFWCVTFWRKYFHPSLIGYSVLFQERDCLQVLMQLLRYEIFNAVS